jgi:benzoate/toluate 1,2-dioxygenase beta subunit
VTLLTRSEAEDLLYREAKLLDHKQYDEWLNMFTEDGKYWIPSWINESELVSNPKLDLSLTYLDRKGMEEYVKRTHSADAHAHYPPARTSLMITNVMLEAVEGEEQQVFSKWLLHEYRQDNQQFFGGENEYRLRKVDGQVKISFKKIIVINDWVKFGHLRLI